MILHTLHFPFALFRGAFFPSLALLSYVVTVERLFHSEGLSFPHSVVTSKLRSSLWHLSPGFYLPVGALPHAFPDFTLSFRNGDFLLKLLLFLKRNSQSPSFSSTSFFLSVSISKEQCHLAIQAVDSSPSVLPHPVPQQIILVLSHMFQISSIPDMC